MSRNAWGLPLSHFIITLPAAIYPVRWSIVGFDWLVTKSESRRVASRNVGKEITVHERDHLRFRFRGKSTRNPTALIPPRRRFELSLSSTWTGGLSTWRAFHLWLLARLALPRPCLRGCATELSTFRWAMWSAPYSSAEISRPAQPRGGPTSSSSPHLFRHQPVPDPPCPSRLSPAPLPRWQQPPFWLVIELTPAEVLESNRLCANEDGPIPKKETKRKKRRERIDDFAAQSLT